ncbi:MAG: GNAT family N-acetyltransferase [Neomegalonema sp.]|nr:GNAT family N-acetyltransferase [Neomegalonema sp.]
MTVLDNSSDRVDFTELAAAFRAAFPAWRAPWSEATFANFAADPRILWLEARSQSGDFAGLALAQMVGDEAELLTIFRSPTAAQSGIGALLMGRLIDRFKEKKIVRLFLEVDEKNVRALALYARFGFEKVGKRPGYYRVSGGVRHDALILVRDFAEPK